MNKKEARIYFKKLRHEIINKDDYNHIIYDRVMKLINEDNIKRIAIFPLMMKLKQAKLLKLC